MAAYLTIAEAQDYFDGRLDSAAWDDAEDEDKTKALVTATRSINNLNFIGSKSSSDQANEFPRKGQDEVPQAILDATCEEAYQLLDGIIAEKEIKNLVVTDHTLMAKVMYKRDSHLPNIRAGIMSSEAWLKLLPYLVDPLNIRIVRV